ncbi:MAG TPA: glucose 1-dehydrogenase [Candidatus Limnocylindrales bacterium]|nr:glucose 1-dehydrogenase [Candidatus Limnocylindrales bacterium]
MTPAGGPGGPSPPPVAELLDLAGQVAIVTGASRGIGAGIALRLAEAGADVVVVHRSAASAPAAVTVAAGIEALGRRGLVAEADLALTSAVEALFDRVMEAFGRIDILVNDAGLQPVADLLAMGVEEWDAIQAVNARGVFLATQAAARRMIVAGEGGSIVDVASIEGLQPAFSHSHYAASKAAVIMHARAAALELGPHGIRVNAVAPGLIDTGDLTAAWPEGVERWHAAAPLGRLGTPADVADACLFLCSPAARWISGATLVVDGGVLAHPTW